jgi:hypothetical protein
MIMADGHGFTRETTGRAMSATVSAENVIATVLKTWRRRVLFPMRRL